MTLQYATILVVDEHTGETRGFLTQGPNKKGTWKVVQDSNEAGRWLVGNELDNARKRYHRYLKNRYAASRPKVELKRGEIPLARA